MVNIMDSLPNDGLKSDGLKSGRLLNGLIDTHAHLFYLAERGFDVAALLTGLFAEGFAGILDIGTDAGDLSGRVAAFSRFAQVRFAAGNWPYTEAIEQRHEKIARLEQEIGSFPAGRVAAVGECGFDRKETPEYSAAERELLELQLDLARRTGLPVIIHSREAYRETLETLTAFPDVRGVIHCFTYGPQEAAAFLDLGYFISFAGNLTYKNAATIREALKVVPDDRLLLETDCPFLAPVPNRGKACEPGMVGFTYALAAEIRNTPLDALKVIAARNARSLFGL
jgi:TatD DNase family protein